MAGLWRAAAVWAVWAVFAGTVGGAVGQGKTGLTVCPDPARPCRSAVKEFAPFELPFRVPPKVKDNVDYVSAPFYAVVLKTYADPPCDGGEFSKATEADRKKAQAAFPGRKAFADHQCPNMDAVSYTIDGKPNTGSFVAVFGGAGKAEAEKLLAKAKATWPGAAVRRMTVGWQRIVQ